MGRLVQPLVTQRLTLVSCSREAAQAAIADRAHLQSLLGVDIPEDWPDEDWRDFLPIYARPLEADPDVLGWGIWLILHPGQHALVGSIGFKGKSEHGAVETGYGIVPTIAMVVIVAPTISRLSSKLFLTTPYNRTNDGR